MKPITYSRHALDQLTDRSLSRTWVEQVATKPEWTEPDPKDDTLKWKLAPVAELDGRYLRVVVRETKDHIHVITVCPDRRAAKRHARQHLRS